MKNRDVFIKKLKLPEKYLEDKAVSLVLRKPGTLSKKEKEWLKSYVFFLELKDITTPEISRTRLSQDFIRSLKKGD